ncbi:hypothetical protein [Candidatus Enterococcus mansonii]|uniref:Phage protein n=1 Tax=Candidatus Enterococcus mansonii TaxID=1834181 RepID=A0A242CIJ5_9ENTE|nr:hypothetical protein [Enterococcus sp. 4G2_DIV0659]OTO09602.1 hypothetical protein A5880_000281 [Enterococcus sp. 4G2_DIV0659]
MTMTKEAIQYLMEQGIRPDDRLVNFDSGTRWMVINNDGDAREIQPKVYLADPLEINTLSGFVNYIKANIERINNKLIVQIKNEQTVHLKGIIEEDGSRECLATASAIIPRFHFDNFYDMEEFNIALQSKFVSLTTEKDVPDDRSLLLQVVGNVAEKNVKQASDDGVSQAITINQGVATQANVQIPNPVLLAPYRTFLEVEQPASQFVFRMKDGPRAAIFEADGGAWRNQAIVNIREFLLEALEEEIKSERITIIA